jgi:hypothetical protein
MPSAGSRTAGLVCHAEGVSESGLESLDLFRGAIRIAGENAQHLQAKEKPLEGLAAALLARMKDVGLAIELGEGKVNPAGRLLDSFARAGYAVVWHGFLLTAPL